MTARDGDLHVDAAELKARPGSQQHLHRTTVMPEGFSTVLIGFPAGSELDLDLRLESVHEGVLMTGRAAATTSGQCGRCLDEIGEDITVDVMQLFTWPERSEAATSEDLDDEDERVIGEDLVIDLEPVLRDLLVAALPFQPVCREDCPGLCSQCGFRMEEDPEHVHEQIDPRWAALAELMEESPEDPSST